MQNNYNGCYHKRLILTLLHYIQTLILLLPRYTAEGASATAAARAGVVIIVGCALLAAVSDKLIQYSHTFYIR